MKRNKSQKFSVTKIIISIYIIIIYVDNSFPNLIYFRSGVFNLSCKGVMQVACEDLLVIYTTV